MLKCFITGTSGQESLWTTVADGGHTVLSLCHVPLTMHPDVQPRAWHGENAQ